jgi:hypothetical protein
MPIGVPAGNNSPVNFFGTRESHLPSTSGAHPLPSLSGNSSYPYRKIGYLYEPGNYPP